MTKLKNSFIFEYYESIRKIWAHLNVRRRFQFALLLILMIVASFAEVLSIGAVLPFLGVLISPSKIYEHAYAQPLVNFLGIDSPTQLLLPVTMLFGAAAITAGSMRLTLLWFTTRLSFAVGADLSIDIYRRTLYQPYSVHIARNSSEVITGISQKAGTLIFSAISPTLSILSSSAMLTTILIALISIDPVIALSSIGGFGLIYGVVLRLTRRRQKIYSELSSLETIRVLQILQEGLGGIRDILLDGTQTTYCQIYRKSDLLLRRAQGNNIVIGLAPRYIIESLGMVLIAGFAYFLLLQHSDFASTIPVLGAFALGAQRLLPVLQQAYGSITTIRGNHAAVLDAIALLEQPLPEYITQPDFKPLAYNSCISLCDVSFRYAEGLPLVLKKVNLNIAKGSRVGILGTTGSGKSTLIDIILALLNPTEGVLKIDNTEISGSNQRAWQSHIAHVPQSIFLADTTIAENIAFGVPIDKINLDRVKYVAQLAQIAPTIESMHDKYETRVGERGIRLSGGQRQRIGIARALYKNSQVIIFDEATSALDNETENAVMSAIDNLDSQLTIIIIAHRLTTLRNCDTVIELSKGRVLRAGSYDDIIGDPKLKPI